jgi:D-serine deaminase-like pyridoxal phosphate-dependent protein
MRIEDLETPAIVVDAGVMQNNMQALSRYTREHRLALRPHTKTHKIPELARLQIASGASGLTVAKSGEAQVMADAGLDNILVHYPVFGTAKLGRLAQLALGRRVTMAIDSLVTAQAISEAASAAHTTIGILVEFDVGMRRCGVATQEDVKSLALAVDQLPGLKFRGVSLYPGHIWLPPAEQSPALQTVAEKLSDVLSILHTAGLACEVVSGGSTPTAFQSHLVPGLTEIRPGTYIFNDRNTMDVGACMLAQCALTVHVTVVSNAVRGRAIVDGGSKTFSGDRLLSGTKADFGYVVNHPSIRFFAMSEEHGHLDVSESSYQPKIGDRLAIIPNHVCACVNMHQQIHYQQNGIVEGCWTVAARGLIQ